MKTISRVLLAALVFGLGLIGGEAAFAADLNYDAPTTINLSSPAISLTIVSGSKATTLVVNAGNVVATIPASSNFYLSSASRGLTVSGNSGAATIDVSCNSNSVDTATVATGGSAETLTFTPTALQCYGGSSGVVVGGGGGGTTTTTPPPAPDTTTPPPPATTSGTGAHANGTLILDNGTIYLIQNGQKLGFRNPEEYFSYGYKFEQSVAASDADRALTASSQSVAKALDGTLALDKTDNRTIYMIAAGQKRGFTSAQVFQSLGYKFTQAVPINLSDYPAGDPIVSSDLAHPNGALVLDTTGTVWWILNGQRQGFESADVFFTYGFKFDKTVKANTADLTLAEGSLVKFRDGTLVKDGSTYYLISDGKKKAFISAEDLTVKGYKTTNAISASLSKYDTGGLVQ